MILCMNPKIKDGLCTFCGTTHRSESEELRALLQKSKRVA